METNQGQFQLSLAIYSVTQSRCTSMKRMRSLGLCLALSGLSLSVGAVDGIGVSSEVSSSAVTQVKKYKKRSRAAIWKEHHFEVSFSKGRIVRVRYLRNKDNKVLIESHPGGRHPEDKIEKTVNLSVQKFRKEIKKYINKYERRVNVKPKKSLPDSVGTKGVISLDAQSDDGIGLGADPSVGYLGPQSQCYNFTTNLTLPVTNINLSEVQSADSFADMYNVSMSLSGKSALFRASATATLGGNYAASSYSGAMFFGGSIVYNAHNSFIGLNDYMASLCGSEFVSDIPVGMLVSSQFTWDSSSSSASKSISASLSGSGSSGLTKINAGVSAAYSASNSNSSTSFGFLYTVVGGDSTATAAVALAYTTYQNNLEYCFSGSAGDCTTFANGFTSGVANALSSYQSYLESASFVSSPGSPSALNSLGVFQDGLAGVSLPYEIQTVPLSTLISTGSYPDSFLGYSDSLTNYLNIMNQISSLYNRAQDLGVALGEGTYNPIPMWDLKSQITYLSNTYLADLNSMQVNLNRCMGTSNNAANDCAAITSVYGAGVTNAYEWYASDGPNPNNISAYNQLEAQQNTIALQYAATFMDNNGSFPMSVIWVNQTPSSWYAPTGFSNTLPSNVPALVGFADSPWYYGGVWYTMSSVHFYTPGSGGLITDPTSSWEPYVFNMNNSYWGYGNGWGTTFSLNGQEPSSFQYPSGLSMNTPASYNQNVTFSPIGNFFN